jgi:hypothetical protein
MIACDQHLERLPLAGYARLQAGYTIVQFGWER